MKTAERHKHHIEPRTKFDAKYSLYIVKLAVSEPIFRKSDSFNLFRITRLGSP